MTTYAKPSELLLAYKALAQADYTYAQHQTPDNNLAICRAQRIYYVALAKYNNHILPRTHALAKRAQMLVQRAHQNRKRLKQDTAWQSLTLHQVRRAQQIYNRARAIRDVMRTDKEMEEYLNPTPAPTPPTVTRRKRVIHPITRRYIYVDTPYTPKPTKQQHTA